MTPFLTAVKWHQPLAQGACWVFAGAVLVLWVAVELRHRSRRITSRTVWLVLALAAMLAISHYGYWPGPADEAGDETYCTIAWPWYSPIGCTVALVFGYLLSRREAPA